MPLYEYVCVKCKATIEIQQKMNEKIPPICCNEGCSIEMEPVISRSNFSLKGSTWAKDGYSSKK